MTTLNFLDELALLGFSIGNDQGVTSGKLRDTLKPLLCKRRPDFSALLPRLAELSLIEELPRAPRARASRWRLAVRGRETLESRLGGESSRGRGWMMKAARTLATGRMLAVTPRTATLLASQQDALATFYLATRLGTTFEPGMTTLTLARELAATQLGVMNARPETLWNGLMERALASDPDGEEEAREPGPVEPFSAQLRRAARRTRDGWFGPHKIFIHFAWRAWRRETHETLGLSDFKERLLHLLRTGEIALTRADFTATLDPADLTEAEIRDGGETFHFLTFAPENR